MQRLQAVAGHVAPASAVSSTLTIRDNRTGKSIDVAVTDNTIRPTDLKKLTSAEGKPLKTFDPGYMNTTCCISKISFINGEKGILRYRGIPIEQLAEKSNYLETAYLLLYGNLPTKDEYLRWTRGVMDHTHVHQDLVKFHDNFRHDAHPMGMLTASFAALGTLYPEQNPALSGQEIYKEKAVRDKQIMRIIGAGPTLAAMAYRKRVGKPFVPPNPELSYMENFLYMLDVGHDVAGYKPHPALVKALDVLFLLHAEHELNCSTSAMRHLASSNVDVYTAISAACGALYGPRHGGANEAVLRMLTKIGDVKNVDAFIHKVKNKEEKLMGFGHRVYKSYDPRAKIVRQIADEIFRVTGSDPLIEVAMKLEKIALSDEYFIGKQLYPNVDFYSGLIYKAMGIPTDVFTVLFAIPRLCGWLAHWDEWIMDPENRIYRPFQVYKGVDIRDYESAEKRSRNSLDPQVARSQLNRRRDTSLNRQAAHYTPILPGNSD